ncbi:Hypothetical_protein [Hexamita inflata]|uniref:Hypothetical_protein n=1 Tax=Hexamita inflata TaxID=28002 RepID=A0ABP1HYU4_9EUKA
MNFSYSIYNYYNIYIYYITIIQLSKVIQRSKVRETVKLPEEGHRERRQASRVWEQGKKAKPKATLDRTGSEQPSTIEDLEHERVRKINYYGKISRIDSLIHSRIELDKIAYKFQISKVYIMQQCQFFILKHYHDSKQFIIALIFYPNSNHQVKICMLCLYEIKLGHT